MVPAEVCGARGGNVSGMERDPRPHEDDIDPDDAQALSRPDDRVGHSAPDIDDSGETGAERRAEEERKQQ